MTQPGSNCMCTVEEREARDTSDRKGNSDYILGNKSVHGESGEVLEKEGLWNLHPWRSSRLDWTRPWET